MTGPEEPTEPPLPPQSYPPQSYPPPSYPDWSYPDWSYPTESYPAEPYRTLDPTRPYPAPSSPPSGAYPPPYQHPQYASPQPAHPTPWFGSRPPTTSAGPGAFAFGFLALLMGWVPVFGIVGMGCGVAGVVLALRALQLAKLGWISDRGLAIAGIVLSCIGVAAGLVVNLALLVTVVGR